MRSVYLAMTTAGAVLLAMPASAAVQICTWANPEGGLWSIPANWSTGLCPDALDEAANTLDDGYSYAITLDVNVQLAWFTFENPQAELHLGNYMLEFLDESVSVNAGTIVTDPYTVPNIFGNFTNAMNGVIEVRDGANLYLYGNDQASAGPIVSNFGQIIVDPFGAETETVLWLGNDLTLAGSGELLLTGDGMAEYASSPTLPIPDNDQTGVSDTIVVGESFNLLDLQVAVNITHTWVGDLCVTLSKDGGPETVLIQRMGDPGLGCGAGACCACSANTLNVTLDDAASSSIEDQCIDNLTGTYSPFQSVAGYVGGDSAGSWTIRVSDNAGADTGNLVSWALIMQRPADLRSQLKTSFTQATNGAFHTITGVGDIHAAMINEGYIVADQSVGTLTIAPVPIVPDQPDVTFLNNGYIYALDSGSIVLDQQASAFEQHGTVYIDPNGSMNVYFDNYTQMEGVTSVNGILRVPDAGRYFDMQGGTLAGRGLVEGDVTVTDGAIVPGGTAHAGMLTIDGDFVQTDGAMAIDLATDTDYDALNVSGYANVGGKLYIAPVGLYIPSPGLEFVILQAGTLGPGQFDKIISSGATYDVIYDDTAGTITVKVLDQPFMPDVDGDGLVGINDLLLVLANWGQCADCNCPADVNGDCMVGILDFLAVLANWS